ncbi:aldo/keto reductase [Mesorhizobium sp. LHD-90]|uniref:aldo/keto reductase n=1 Tax=Mesorhizobium sp. LHD-90 TaxID=3071414 RepID=UPI0027E08882|nr:aldo/keto reductase [Mesorhizobium sp. LHD-90]MDQ6433847.1 aldo/keto reductase [Mesorhizobium sp. LHD-90]
MNSSSIPQMGLGTFGRTGDAGIEALLTAIEVGYRHIDTAQSYDTESSVGAAIRRSGLPRGDFFVTTKVADTNLDKASFMPSVEKSLETLGMDRVDLLLIHWPSQHDQVPFEHYMLALAEAKAKGFARLIGVSNFPIADLERTRALLGEGAIATDQVEIHPYLQSPKLRDFSRSRSLTLTAYQPLYKGKVNDDPVLRKIGASHGVSAAAAGLAFLMQEGHVVIPASSSRANLDGNFAALKVRLSEDEMNRIRALDRGLRHINPTKSPRWDD